MREDHRQMTMEGLIVSIPMFVPWIKLINTIQAPDRTLMLHSCHFVPNTIRTLLEL
jgi:hypothetical protein